MNDKNKQLALTILTLALVGIFLVFGGGKLIDPVKWADKFTGWGYPEWFVIVAGLLEFLGAIGLLIPLLRGPAGLALALFMVGAVSTHLAYDEIGMTFVAIAIMVACAVVGRFRMRETLTYLRKRW